MFGRHCQAALFCPSQTHKMMMKMSRGWWRMVDESDAAKLRLELITMQGWELKKLKLTEGIWWGTGISSPSAMVHDNCRGESLRDEAHSSTDLGRGISNLSEVRCNDWGSGEAWCHPVWEEMWLVGLQKTRWQIRSKQVIHNMDVPKTAIMTLFGLFEFLCMSFGLWNVNQTFQWLMGYALRGLMASSCTRYMHDILITSVSPNAQACQLCALATILQEHGIIMCQFSCLNCSFLTTFLTPLASGSSTIPSCSRDRFSPLQQTS